MSKPVLEVVALKESLEEQLLKRPGVTAVDVGFKYVGGQRTDEVAIRVMVAQKKSDLPAAERVPDHFDGVKTDVIERRYFLHDAMKNKKRESEIGLQADATNYDPVKGGISIGPCRAVGGFVFVGTLGAIVKDNASGNPLLLSNFHVMCIDNGWHAGDTMAQPGRVDGGQCPANVVGALQRAALTAKVDCAVSSLSGRGYSCEIVDIGKVAGTATATLNMPVRKRGRTTGLTYGFVDSISLSVNIDYGNGIGVKTLTNQIGIRPDTTHNTAFGDHGDSGSAVVDGTVHVVGLHFAGSSDGHGIANQIADVLSALNVSMCTATSKALIKDFKDHKHEKVEVKEHKIEKLEHKELKIEKLEHKELKFEKRVPELPPGKIIVEGPTFPTQPGDPAFPGLPGQPGAGMQGALAGAAPKLTDKPLEKIKPEIKDFKQESKDHKDSKDHKEIKEHKDHKDAKDNPDHKQFKDAKDHKDQKEHKELKDHHKEFKIEKLEFEKPPATENIDPKLLVETGPQLPPGIDPAGPGGGLEQRMAQLEAIVASLSTFISPELRPDLGSGALTNEQDGCKGC
ncbi:hypothetical protein [Roseateles sp.]|uniref:hypothetical protein n=1 Tax=Roseateles sp. TaxID=1971397 RepID=UPI0039E7DB9B